MAWKFNQGARWPQMLPRRGPGPGAPLPPRGDGARGSVARGPPHCFVTPLDLGPSPGPDSETRLLYPLGPAVPPGGRVSQPAATPCSGSHLASGRDRVRWGPGAGFCASLCH